VKEHKQASATIVLLNDFVNIEYKLLITTIWQQLNLDARELC
jgi:hypothetical protein